MEEKLKEEILQKKFQNQIIIKKEILPQEAKNIFILRDKLHL